MSCSTKCADVPWIINPSYKPYGPFLESLICIPFTCTNPIHLYWSSIIGELKMVDLQTLNPKLEALNDNPGLRETLKP